MMKLKNHTKTHQFEPLMTIYFNEGLTLEELKKIKASSKIIGIKALSQRCYDKLK